MKIALIGCGSIGQFLLEAINKNNHVVNSKIEWIFDERKKNMEKIKGLASEFWCSYSTSQVEVFQSDVDIIVECANPETAKYYALNVLNQGKDYVIASAGALTDSHFYKQIEDSCTKNGRNVYVPSGAIGGLDAIRSANALGQIEEIQLTTKKPPQALGMEIEGEQPVSVFSGPAREAIVMYPKNINVAITLSMASLGVDKTRVEIVADPTIKRNTHHVQVKGNFGEINVTLANEPMPTNPKTSYMAALSIVGLLKQLAQPIKTGF